MKTMKSVLVIVFLATTLISCFGGGGLTHRYMIKLDKGNGNALIEGYYYFGTFDNGYIKGQESFLDFIIKNNKDTLVIYPDIKSIVIDRLKTDFILRDTGIKLHKSDIVSIELLEEHSYPMGDGMDYVNKSEFEIINDKPVSIEYYDNDFIGENCGYVFVAFDNNNKITELRNEFIQAIDGIRSSSSRRYYLNIHKTKTTKFNVLLFLSCGMM